MLKEHERYLLKAILSNSLSSENPSKETIERGLKTSNSYFQQFKENLLKEYKGKKLEDIEGSKVVSTDSGETLKIINKEKMDFKLSENNIKEELRKNLKLIPNIGVNTELKLKEKGYLNIDSLKNHDRYSNKAIKLSKTLDDSSLDQILCLLNKNKYNRECRNNLLRCASLVNKEDFKFMDIETLGLSNVPVILIGIAEFKGNKIISSQYLLRDKSEEPAILEGYLSHLDENSVHISYNGLSFDFPFIKNRCNYYGINSNLDNPHFDLIYFTRNLWKDKLPNCKLKTIEKYIFNIERENDVPGEYIPSYYETYLDESNIGPLIPIIEHNKQDIVSLASFLMKLYDEVNY